MVPYVFFTSCHFFRSTSLCSWTATVSQYRRPGVGRCIPTESDPGGTPEGSPTLFCSCFLAAWTRDAESGGGRSAFRSLGASCAMGAYVPCSVANDQAGQHYRTDGWSYPGSNSCEQPHYEFFIVPTDGRKGARDWAQTQNS